MKLADKKFSGRDDRDQRKALVRFAGDSRARILFCDINDFSENGIRIPRSLMHLAREGIERRREDKAWIRFQDCTPLSEAFDKRYRHPKAKRKCGEILIRERR